MLSAWKLPGQNGMLSGARHSPKGVAGGVAAPPPDDERGRHSADTLAIMTNEYKLKLFSTVFASIKHIFSILRTLVQHRRRAAVHQKRRRAALGHGTGPLRLGTALGTGSRGGMPSHVGSQDGAPSRQDRAGADVRRPAEPAPRRPLRRKRGRLCRAAAAGAGGAPRFPGPGGGRGPPPSPHVLPTMWASLVRGRRNGLDCGPAAAKAIATATTIAVACVVGDGNKNGNKRRSLFSLFRARAPRKSSFGSALAEVLFRRSSFVRPPRSSAELRGAPRRSSQELFRKTSSVGGILQVLREAPRSAAELRGGLLGYLRGGGLPKALRGAPRSTFAGPPRRRPSKGHPPRCPAELQGGIQRYVLKGLWIPQHDCQIHQSARFHLSARVRKVSQKSDRSAPEVRQTPSEDPRKSARRQPGSPPGESSTDPTISLRLSAPYSRRARTANGKEAGPVLTLAWVRQSLPARVRRSAKIRQPESAGPPKSTTELVSPPEHLATLLRVKRVKSPVLRGEQKERCLVYSTHEKVVGTRLCSNMLHDSSSLADRVMRSVDRLEQLVKAPLK
eukprot:gene2827-biopygen2281